MKRSKPKSRQGAARKGNPERRLVVLEPADRQVEVVIPRWDGQRSHTSSVTRQYSNEGDAAYRAFCDYCLQGPARSFANLYATYREDIEQIDRVKAMGDAVPAGVPIPNEPPTRRLSTLKEWSSSFDWGRRVQAYDDFFVREQLRMYRGRLAMSLGKQLDLIDKGFKIASIAIDEVIANYKATGKLGIPFRDAVRLFDLSLRHYRQTLGLTSDSPEQGINAFAAVDESTMLEVDNQDLEVILATLADAMALDDEGKKPDAHDYDQYGED